MRIKGTTALVVGTVLFLAATKLLTSTAAVGDRIPLGGLQTDQEGMAAWNAGAGAPEPEMSGHQTVWTGCSAFAPYYLASRDFRTIDPGASAGLRAGSTIQGLSQFAAALADNGFT